MTDLETRAHNRLSKVGFIVLIMAMLSLSIVLWTSYQDRQDTQCQKEVNQEFYSFSKDRAALADDDRAAFRLLVDRIQAAKTQELVDAAFSEYNATADALDARRDKLVAPTPESICTN